MNVSKTVVGVDIAKRVFQLHWIDQKTGEIVSVQLKREKFLEHFANRAPCRIGMEACGGSQHWARKLTDMGHQVKLMPGKAVRPFVGGNKSDAHDARAIWTAVQQPNVKAVAVKTEEQQAILALHRMRQQFVKFRTAQINGLRGMLAEYGEVMPLGRAGIRKGISEALQHLSDRLPAMVIDTLRKQWARIGELECHFSPRFGQSQERASLRTRNALRFPRQADQARPHRWLPSFSGRRPADRTPLLSCCTVAAAPTRRTARSTRAMKCGVPTSQNMAMSH